MINFIRFAWSIWSGLPGQFHGSSSLLVKIYYFVLIRKIGRIKNRLILTGIFIELGVIEIEYELNKINVFTKIDEEPISSGFYTYLFVVEYLYLSVQFHPDFKICAVMRH